MLEFCPPFGWHEVTLSEVTAIQKRLAAFESMTWKEILHQSNDDHHFIPVEKLCGPAQERLALIAPDVDEVMSLRIAKKRRVYGIMDQEVCQIVFWDPLHLVYPMNIADN